MVKNQPANTGGIRDVGLIPGSGRSLGGGNDTHSIIPVWKSLDREPDRLWSMGSWKVGHD